MKEASRRRLCLGETWETKNELNQMHGRQEEKEGSHGECPQDWDKSEVSQVVDSQEINTANILSLR